MRVAHLISNVIGQAWKYLSQSLTFYLMSPPDVSPKVKPNFSFQRDATHFRLAFQVLLIIMFKFSIRDPLQLNRRFQNQNVLAPLNPQSGTLMDLSTKIAWMKPATINGNHVNWWVNDNILGRSIPHI